MEEDKTLQLLRECREEMTRLNRLIKIYEATIEEVVHIFTTNPPGDLDQYTPDMFKALVNCKDHPEQWRRYLLRKGIERVNTEESLEKPKEED